MFATAFIFAGMFVAGLVIGAVGHSYFAVKAAATESEIASWVIRLRGALAVDEKVAKAKIEALVKEIEEKL
jgi:hypothetical protein